MAHGPPSPPGHPPSLLPGRSAKYWSDRIGWAGVGFVFFGTLMGIFAILPGYNPVRDAGIVVATLGAMTCVLASVYPSRQWTLAMKREREAGYTTLPWRGWARFWQLDPHTGAVVRQPNHLADGRWAPWIPKDPVPPPPVDGPPRLLPQRSARFWARVASLLCVILMVLATALAIVGIVDEGRGSVGAQAKVLSLTVGLVFFFLIGWPARRWRISADRESAAGYTTQGPVGRFWEQLKWLIKKEPRRYDHLWRLDPRTGRVIRPPRTPPPGSGPSPDVAGSDGPGSGVPL